ncbi:MAG: hypothetical protein ACRCSP_09580 [Rhodoglobus sp.]
MAKLTSLLSSASLALGSSSPRIRELSRAGAALTVTVPLSRRIGFVQQRGGAGASALVGAVASTLATRRGGHVLGVNASRGSTSLPWQVGVTPGYVASERRSTAKTSRDAVEGLAHTASGLRVLDLVQENQSHAPARTSRWYEEVAPIARFFDIVCTDWGVREFQVDLGDVADSSHAVCIVSRADRHAIDDAAALIPALLERDQAPAVILAIVDVGGTGSSAAPWLEGKVGAPVLHIPFDAARASATAQPSSALATRTRIAQTRLAAAVLSASLSRPTAALDSLHAHQDGAAS